tara:strand:- start:3881 stop:4090 length:210 start_codon:yes stop_codon:yes gene_type:complete
MKLTKAQRARLDNYGWDVIDVEVDGKEQNCQWVSIAPEDGVIFGEICEHFELTGEGEDVKLLVVGTRED